MKCVRRRECAGRATMPLLVALRTVDSLRVTAPHNHEADQTYLEKMELRQRILHRCKNEAGDFRRIFDEECAR